MSLRRREGLAALSGLLLVLSFPKFGHGAVAWAALLPLLIALPGVSGWPALRLGYVTGAVAGLGLLYWTALVVTQFGGLSLPVAALVMALLCLAVAAFPAAFAWVVARWLERLGPAGLLLAPLAWVATEMVRSYTALRFPWALLGYSQWSQPAVIQIASLTAVYGVSALVASSSAALAYCAHEPRLARRIGALAGALALIGGATLWGALSIGAPLDPSGRVRVGLVQASIPQDQKWSEQAYFDNLTKHVALTRRAAAEGAKLIVWPESAVPYRFDDDPGAADLLRNLARETGAHLAFGNDDHHGGVHYVGAKMLAPDGRLALRYHKMRLVPFGEYVPLQPLLTLGGRYAAKLVQQVADFTPGERAEIGAAGRPLGIFICYEAIFPDLVRQFTESGAELLVNVTNDGWYGRTSAPYQHLAMAVFRAVENRRYLVRAANTGISAIVDPWGRVQASTRLFEARALVGEVSYLRAQTAYSRFGDVFGWACLLASLGLTLMRRAPRR
ncbi:MAG: apolipoprotein N-acyltransferase [Vicinamibacteria bacterium]